MGVDGVQLSMQTSLNGDLSNALFTLIVYYISNYVPNNHQSFVFMSEYLLQVQRYVWSGISIDSMSVGVSDAIGEVNFFVGEVVNCDLEVAWVQTWNYLSDSQLSSDVAMVFVQKFM